MSNYKVQVNTYSDPLGVWTGNAAVYDTADAATEAAKSLFMRWTAVNYWRVVDDADSVIDTNEGE